MIGPPTISGTGRRTLNRDGPRNRNSDATRTAILEGALQQFSRGGYDEVGVRDIAREVGVDASLVNRYFGGKEGLFSAVLDRCADVNDLVAGERSDFGARAAALLMGDGDGYLRPLHLRILLRSIGSRRALEIARTTGADRFYGPLRSWLGGAQAEVQVRLIASLMIGVTIDLQLYVNQDPLAVVEFQRRVAELLQSLVDRPPDDLTLRVMS